MVWARWACRRRGTAAAGTPRWRTRWTRAATTRRVQVRELGLGLSTLQRLAAGSWPHTRVETLHTELRVGKGYWKYCNPTRRCLCVLPGQRAKALCPPPGTGNGTELGAVSISLAPVGVQCTAPPSRNASFKARSRSVSHFGGLAADARRGSLQGPSQNGLSCTSRRVAIVCDWAGVPPLVYVGLIRSGATWGALQYLVDFCL